MFPDVCMMQKICISGPLAGDSGSNCCEPLLYSSSYLAPITMGACFPTFVSMAPVAAPVAQEENYLTVDTSGGLQTIEIHKSLFQRDKPVWHLCFLGAFLVLFLSKVSSYRGSVHRHPCTSALMLGASSKMPSGTLFLRRRAKCALIAQS